MSQDENIRELEDVLQSMMRHARVRTRELARAVHPELDPTAYPLVTMLGRTGPMRMSDLAAGLALDKSTVSRQVDAVHRIGLVERVPDPDDARARLVRLTDSGRDSVGRQLRDRRRRLWDSLSEWEDGEVRDLTRLLRRLLRSKDE